MWSFVPYIKNYFFCYDMLVSVPLFSLWYLYWAQANLSELKWLLTRPLAFMWNLDWQSSVKIFCSFVELQKNTFCSGLYSKQNCFFSPAEEACISLATTVCLLSYFSFSGFYLCVTVLRVVFNICWVHVFIPTYMIVYHKKYRVVYKYCSITWQNNLVGFFSNIKKSLKNFNSQI